MRIALLTAGAAGMYCGSCMHDNTLAAALGKLGHDALLIPTYTPISTDEESVSKTTVFFGGINVYLEQQSLLYRLLPRPIKWLLDRPWLLRLVGPLAQRTDYADMAALTISMLKGTEGKQREEVERLIRYLKDDVQPDVLILTNALLSGIIPTIQKVMNIPILIELQGDDIFLEALRPNDKSAAIAQIGRNCTDVAGYLLPCSAYADFMAGYLRLPRERMHVIYPGLNLKGHGGTKPVRPPRPRVVGYFARICPEKGLHNLVDAFLDLGHRIGFEDVRLHISGFLKANNRAYFTEQLAKVTAVGLGERVLHVESPTLADKVRFLQGCDVLSVPTDYREPKGLYVLEALANGVPVVQPRHGSFPELLAATEGGLLVEPGSPKALADGLAKILADEELRHRCATRGQESIRTHFTAEGNARTTLDVVAKLSAERKGTA